jgi:hypothetical protein
LEQDTAAVVVSTHQAIFHYHYKKVLKKRILDKRKELTDDIHLITKAEDKLAKL